MSVEKYGLIGSAQELAREWYNNAASDEKYKYISSSEANWYIFNRLKQDVESKAALVRLKNPGAIKFVLNTEEPKTNDKSIKQKILSDQGIQLKSGAKKTRKRKT